MNDEPQQQRSKPSLVIDHEAKVKWQSGIAEQPPATDDKPRGALTHDGKRDAMTPLWEAEQPPATDDQQVENLARDLHDIYERLAPDFDYETRKETREFDPQSPNGRLMIAVCRELQFRALRETKPPATDSIKPPKFTAGGITNKIISETPQADFRGRLQPTATEAKVKDKHASEREWTPKILKRITRNTELSPLVEEFIIHAHNAALADERQKRHEAELEVDERGRTIIHYKQQLADEQKKRDRAESKAGEYLIAGDTVRRECERLEQQLAAECQRREDLQLKYDELDFKCEGIKQQLAAERKKLKPLVEALELTKRDLIAEGRYYGSDLEGIIEKALAKVKDNHASEPLGMTGVQAEWADHKHASEPDLSTAIGLAGYPVAAHASEAKRHPSILEDTKTFLRRVYDAGKQGSEWIPLADGRGKYGVKDKEGWITRGLTEHQAMTISAAHNASDTNGNPSIATVKDAANRRTAVTHVVAPRGDQPPATDDKPRGALTHDGKRDAMTPLWEAEQPPATDDKQAYEIRRRTATFQNQNRKEKE